MHLKRFDDFFKMFVKEAIWVGISSGKFHHELVFYLHLGVPIISRAFTQYGHRSIGRFSMKQCDANYYITTTAF